MGMADDDDYDFSGVSQPGPFNIESSVLSQWRSQNEEEEDDDYSYFWPEQLPYDIEEKLREINKVHQEDETPIESDRPRKITFNTRVQMRAISMRRIPPPAEKPFDEEPFDLSKYDTDESVDDVETSITAPREVAGVAPEAAPESSARPMPVPAASSSRSPAGAGPAGQLRQRFANKTAVSRVGQSAAKSAAGVSTSGFTSKGGGGGGGGRTRRGFRDSQNSQLYEGLASDRLSVLSLTDEESEGDDDDDCVVDQPLFHAGHSSGSAAAGDPAPPQAANEMPALPTGKPTSAIVTVSSSAPVSTQTLKSVPALVSQPISSPVTPAAPSTVTVSGTVAKPAPTTSSTLKLSPAVAAAPKPAPPPVSTSKSASPSASVTSSMASSSVSVMPKPSEPQSVVSLSVAAPAPAPAPKQLSVSPASQPPEAAAQRPPPQSLSAAAHSDEAASGTEPTGSRSWPELASPAEAYRPSWSETLQPASAARRTRVARAASDQGPNQQTDETYRRLAVAKEVHTHQSSTIANSCACQNESNRRCRCKGDSTASNYGEDDIVKELLNGAKSEDSAVESMDDRTSSNSTESGSDGSAGNGLEPPPLPASDQSYAAIHLPRPGRPGQGPDRKHDFTITKAAGGGTARPRLSRSASASRPADGARHPSGQPDRPWVVSGSDRGAAGPGKQQQGQPGGSPSRPRSAPVRGTVSALAPARRQPSTHRAGQQAAGQSAGSGQPRRSRVSSHDPALTFQQWLQQHEKERAQVIQDKRNNVKKRKQEATIKQEKAPQAFRVWLRKKRQQQLMEQRVQQLRQHELLAAAAAAAPGRHQEDAFRQWLARKQRDRERAAAGGGGPAQMSLGAAAAGRPSCPAAELGRVLPGVAAAVLLNTGLGRPPPTLV